MVVLTVGTLRTANRSASEIFLDLTYFGCKSRSKLLYNYCTSHSIAASHCYVRHGEMLIDNGPGIDSTHSLLPRG